MEPHPQLSPRQLEALRLVSSGKRRAQVAREMGISIHTLRGYLMQAFMRLGARNAAEACAKAVADGIWEVASE